MATLTPAFHAECESIHSEHEELLSGLAELDRGLDRLVCYSEVFADFAALDDIRQAGRRLASELPKHCRREEEAVLATVANVSPQLSQFVNEMKNQHKEILLQLQAFCSALVELDISSDLYQAVIDLKRVGEELTDRLRRHIALEEGELSGFLN